ncbi:Niemann-Pick C1 protein [Thraustotheca clavata]|uniref:Niemann-Pick C1 protein n=1 Tax=Thraustotheca clavata TaxID=74557 RepID=A0A1V9Z578_9STRA|nr:Niemann-Pick C1 protein [Thraustotheca clavata]
MSDYKRTVGGRLQLKGGLVVGNKKHKKKKRKTEAEEAEERDEGNEDFELKKLQGTGRILTSGTTVMGRLGTKFLSELSVGDAMIIQHPTSGQEETRIVRMVLSDVSISLSSGFSSDLISTTTFHYIKAPPDEGEKEEKERVKKKKKTEEEAFAFGTYAGGTTAGTQYTYRVKKSGIYGGYAIMKETADSNRSREELLDIRSKKKGDRHCN